MVLAIALAVALWVFKGRHPLELQKPRAYIKPYEQT
jgi:hypothetical protein